MNIVENARELAYKWHEGQMYGNLPYTSHLEDVVSSLSKKHNKFSERNAVLFAASFLHDSLEDTMIPPQDIVDQCGMEVYDAVSALTKWAGYTYEYYIIAVKRNPIALEVKTHDTLCNLTASVMSGEKGRIRKYAEQMLLLVEE